MSAFESPLVDARWLGAHLDEVRVVDSRWYLDGRSAHDAYLAGHIPAAVFVDLHTELSGVATPTDDGLPGGRHPLPDPADFAAVMGRLGIGDGTPVVVYDDVNGGMAARLWWMLHALGESVAVLEGGIGAWTAPLETGRPPAAAAAEFTVRPWPAERLASAADLGEGDLGDGVVLDARSADRYRGAQNAIDARFGHIPGALSAPWTENIDASTGRFKSIEQLSARYEALGACDQPVTAYCGSGVTACVDLLALHMLGITGRLYVGSWSEWGADPTRPIETD